MNGLHPMAKAGEHIPMPPGSGRRGAVAHRPATSHGSRGIPRIEDVPQRQSRLARKETLS